MNRNNNQFVLLLSAILIASVTPSHSFSQTARTKRQIRDLYRIELKLRRSERLSPSEVNVLLNEAKTSTPAGQLSALLTLDEAVKLGQFPLNSWLWLLKDKIVHSKGRRAVLFLDAYQTHLGVSPCLDPELDSLWTIVRNSGASPSNLSNLERNLIRKSASSKVPGGDLYLGNVFVSKSKLPKRDLGWANQLINQRTKRGARRVREYWLFVSEIVRLKNN
jgi:hypothetical protein